LERGQRLQVGSIRAIDIGEACETIREICNRHLAAVLPLRRRKAVCTMATAFSNRGAITERRMVVVRINGEMTVMDAVKNMGLGK
jgi:hypothetical protein